MDHLVKLNLNGSLSIFDPSSAIHQPTLSQIGQKSRTFLKEHAKMVFSAGPQKPGLWWLQETDVLGFGPEYCSQEISRKIRLKSLYGLEYVKHVFLNGPYALSATFQAGFRPEAIHKGSYEQADIQALRIDFEDIASNDRQEFYPDFFSGLRILTIRNDTRLPYENKDCILYHVEPRGRSLADISDINPTAGACRGCDALGWFRLGDTSIDDVVTRAIRMVDHDSWSGHDTVDSHDEPGIGLVIATREGFPGDPSTCDKLSWRDMIYVAHGQYLPRYLG